MAIGEAEPGLEAVGSGRAGRPAAAEGEDAAALGGQAKGGHADVEGGGGEQGEAGLKVYLSYNIRLYTITICSQTP